MIALMADDAISSAELKSLVTIKILASDGSTVVKLYSHLSS